MLGPGSCRGASAGRAQHVVESRHAARQRDLQRAGWQACPFSAGTSRYRSGPSCRYGRQRCGHAPAVADGTGRADVRRGYGYGAREHRERRARRGGEAPPHALCGACELRAAGSCARREGNGACDDDAQDERLHRQFAHEQRVSRSAEVLADPRSRRSHGRGALYSSARALRRHGRCRFATIGWKRRPGATEWR